MLKDKFKPDKFKLALSLAQLSPSLFRHYFYMYDIEVLYFRLDYKEFCKMIHGNDD